jgi:hypothetical protein
MKPRRENGNLKAVEVTGPIYEGHIPRAAALMLAGFQVRSPRLLEPIFKPRRAARVPPPPAWGFVYIFPAGPLLKIGISDAGVEQRWNNIRCSNPLLEPPLYISPPVGKLAREIERGALGALWLEPSMNAPTLADPRNFN